MIKTILCVLPPSLLWYFWLILKCQVASGVFPKRFTWMCEVINLPSSTLHFFLYVCLSLLSLVLCSLLSIRALCSWRSFSWALLHPLCAKNSISVYLLCSTFLPSFTVSCFTLPAAMCSSVLELWPDRSWTFPSQNYFISFFLLFSCSFTVPAAMCSSVLELWPDISWTFPSQNYFISFSCCFPGVLLGQQRCAALCWSSGLIEAELFPLRTTSSVSLAVFL